MPKGTSGRGGRGSGVSKPKKEESTSKSASSGFQVDEEGNPLNYETALSLYEQGGSKGAEGLNRSLRNPTDVGLSRYEKLMIKNLDKGLKPLKVSDKDRIVYRGAKDMDHIFKKIGVGGTFRDKGYLSTSPDKATAQWFSKGGWVMKIRIPKGNRPKGSVVKRDLRKSGIKGVHALEPEILLTRKTKLKIKSLDFDNHVAELTYYD